MTNESTKVQGSVVAAYQRILNGEQTGFSPYEFQPKDRKRKVIELVRFLVEKRWVIPPEQALAEGRFTKDTLIGEHLEALLRYVDPLPEQEEDDASHILYFAYPDLPKPDLKDRVIKVYQEVLDETRKSFPRQYFVDPIYGEERAIICIRHLCEDILNLKPKDVLPYFEGKGSAVLRTYKLKILLNMVYETIGEMLDAAYPDVEVQPKAA